MTKILVLCTGNSCRSQMARAFLKSFDSGLMVRSAGISAVGTVNEGAIKAMAEVGIDISDQMSDPVDVYLGTEWDYVITVCGEAAESCPEFLGTVKNRVHIGFDDPSTAVGDKNYIISEFRRVRDKIKEQLYDFYSSEIMAQ